ncbi:MAG: hypothetical protein PHE89_02850 [Alphaproteobacteria bacterium]|nr:hypothetical protein [Alphaproteobacteria bacterium]
MKETHCFVIWQNARYKEKEIDKDIRSKFQVSSVYEIFWESDVFKKNLQKIYGKNILKTWKKEKQIGTGSFLVYKVVDETPRNLGGKNQNMVEAKLLYREMTGGGHLIHASDTPQEASAHLEIFLNKALSTNIVKLSFA